MVMKMNKREFINKIHDELKLELDKCEIINSTFEDTFIFGKNNKEIICGNLIERLNIDIDEANNIYDKVMNIITTEIKNKIKHPFRNKEKQD